MINKINFRDLPKAVKVIITNARIKKAYSVYPVFVLYSITLIGLLRLGQLVLT